LHGLPIVLLQEEKQPFQDQTVNSLGNFIDEEIPLNILIDPSNQEDNNNVEPQNQEKIQIGFVIIENDSCSAPVAPSFSKETKHIAPNMCALTACMTRMSTIHI
jgi:hypothetical protein